jgi:hypothetical protein
MNVGLQLIDNFLLQYNVGQAILLGFVLVTLGSLALRSMRVVALVFVTFGLVFLTTPSSLAPVHYRFLGVALLVAGPMVFIAGRR